MLQLHTAFYQVRGNGMAEVMQGDVRIKSCLCNQPFDLLRIGVATHACAVSVEQEGFDRGFAVLNLLWPLVEAVIFQVIAYGYAQRDGSLSAAFALAHVQHGAFKVYVSCIQLLGFLSSQAAAVNDSEYGPLFCCVAGLVKFLDIVQAQYIFSRPFVISAVVKVSHRIDFHLLRVLQVLEKDFEREHVKRDPAFAQSSACCRARPVL